MVRFTAATLCVLAVATTNTVTAFAPPRPVGTSNFVARSNTAAVVPYHQQQHAASSSTALQMNLFDRFSRVAKANLNNILKNLEDPEKVMNQALEDMQGDLIKVRQSYAEITATQRRLLKQKEQADAVANDWYKRAQLALEKGNEELAREALKRRQVSTEQAASLQQQIDAQAAAIDKLYDGMQVLEKNILEAKGKKEQMVARARTAQSTQKVNDMLSGVTGKTSMDAFKRMEDKVEALEAAAEIAAEMGSVNGNALPGSSASSLEMEFKRLEASSSVDDELQKMKGLLKGSSSSAPNGSSSNSYSSAPNGSSSAKSSPVVEDELEKLKRDAGM